MICQICKKNEATVTITKVVGLKKTELYLCNDCAHSFLGSTISSFSFSQYNINEILENLLSSFIKLDATFRAMPRRIYAAAAMKTEKSNWNGRFESSGNRSEASE